jgi:chemotaxis protein MotB
VRRRRADENGTPSWLTTYSDMITLVLVFFVLLFSFSTLDKAKLMKFINSIKGSTTQTGELPDLSATDLGFIIEDTPTPTPLVTPEIEEEQFDRLFEQIDLYLQDKSLAKEVFVFREKKGILLRFSDKVLFDSGEAFIKTNAYSILNDIAQMLGELSDMIDIIRVEGHTDNVPIRTSQYPSNWELSASRAVAVVRYFIEDQTLDPLKFSATGYGEYRPIALNDSSENRQRNRRVDIMIERLSEEE